jgi:hypothetical protein
MSQMAGASSEMLEALPPEFQNVFPCWRSTPFFSKMYGEIKASCPEHGKGSSSDHNHM